MAKAKDATIDVPRLCLAMGRARLVLRRPREERREVVKSYVGRHWSEEGSRDRQPVNLLALYVSIMSRNLIAKNPRVMLSTFNRSQKPIVSAMETWCNKEIQRMCLENTLGRCVVDALFSVGICKVALATPAESAGAAWNLRAGAPFAEPVDLDDFVFDVHARDFSEVSFIGHRYRVPLDAIRDDRTYGKSRKDLTASEDPLINQEGDERINVLGRTYLAGEEEFEDMVDLWEIYLPRHRLILTLPDEYISGPRSSAEPLLTKRWLGREVGPYHILALGGVVPGSPMPKGPIQDLVDLHEAANRAYRKAIRTVDRVKEVGMVEGGATEDGNRVLEASDGDIIRVDNPDRIRQMVFSGQAMQNVMLMATSLKDLFAYMAGNLDMMGGLSPQSKTLGQDRLLEANSSRTVSDMQDRTVDFTSEVIESLCWYWHHDPQKIMRTEHPIPGMPEMSIQRTVTPQMRQSGRFEDLEIEVDPYSMQHATPQTRMQSLNQLVQTIVIPMCALLQSQGVVFDLNAYLRMMAKYMDMPDLADIITVQEPPQPDGGMGTGAGESVGPAKPPNTTRSYVRENMPGRTQQGDSLNLQNALRGINTGGNPNGNGAPMGGMK